MCLSLADFVHEPCPDLEEVSRLTRVCICEVKNTIPTVRVDSCAGYRFGITISLLINVAVLDHIDKDVLVCWESWTRFFGCSYIIPSADLKLGPDVGHLARSNAERKVVDIRAQREN